MNARASVLGRVRAENLAAVPDRVTAIADAARARHGAGVCAVLAYGSALRHRADTEKMVDLYLLVDSYDSVHPGRMLRIANAVLPPNVYYLEVKFCEDKVRSKYAIVSLEQFERLVTPAALHPYFWARFAQPTALVWARETKIAERVHQAITTAVLTLIGEAWPLAPRAASAEERWVRAFVETYRTELRSEGPERARELYRTHPARYDAIAGTVADNDGTHQVSSAAAKWRWPLRRVFGKILSVLRLLKAAFTFQDGATYLASKIEQHSGVAVSLTDWQRRHPILASGGLAWRLYRKGAIR